jgi:hypothetical protein
MVRFRMAPVFALVLLMVSGAHAAAVAEWVSPDGQIAIAAPPDGRFSKDSVVEPPALARWVSDDGQTIVVVAQAENPAGNRLVQSGLEEGILKQFAPGKIVSSTASSISGVPAYTIVAQGKLAGAEMFLSQVIVTFNGQVYKVMAGSPADPLADAELAPVMRSLRILNPSPVVPAAMPAASGSAAPGPKSEWERTNELSVKIAEIAFSILMIAAVVAVFRNKARGRARASPQAPPNEPLPPPSVTPTNRSSD